MGISIVDLSYSIEEGMSIFNAPWHPKLSIKQLGTIENEGRETRFISLGSHLGTHIDAPRHFIKNGISIDQISLNRLMGKVTILEFHNLEDNSPITPEMLKDKQLSKRIIFYFGWGKHWKTDRFFKGYPYFTKDALEYLVSQRVELIGMDTPSPDDSRIELGSERDSENHKFLLERGVIIIEYLANLEYLKDLGGWNIVAMPLKLKGADGSPARVCLIKEHSCNT